MRAVVRHFMAVRQADLDLSRIALVAGYNMTGKSSIATALTAALTGNVVPIGEIKRAGYDVFLVLEATIGFNKRDESELDSEVEESLTEEPVETSGKVSFTTHDHRFLKALRIAVDEEA